MDAMMVDDGDDNDAMPVDDGGADSDSGLGSDCSSGMESITSENYAFRWDGPRRYCPLSLPNHTFPLSLPS